MFLLVKYLVYLNRYVFVMFSVNYIDSRNMTILLLLRFPVVFSTGHFNADSQVEFFLIGVRVVPLIMLFCYSLFSSHVLQPREVFAS